MKTLTKRIAGMVAAGLLTVSGVAMIAQPAYAKPVLTNLQKYDNCTAKGGSMKACCAGVGGSYEAEYDDDGKLANEMCTIYERVVSTKPHAGTGVVVSPGGAQPTPTPITSPGTGIVTSPGTPVTQPTPTPVTSRAGTGIVVKPGGALG